MKTRSTLKAYKDVAKAMIAADGHAFLRLGDQYFVPTDPDHHDVRYVKLQVIGPNGEQGGAISAAMIDNFSKSYRLPKLEENK